MVAQNYILWSLSFMKLVVLNRLSSVCYGFFLLFPKLFQKKLILMFYNSAKKTSDATHCVLLQLCGQPISDRNLLCNMYVYTKHIKNCAFTTDRRRIALLGCTYELLCLIVANKIMCYHFHSLNKC